MDNGNGALETLREAGIDVDGAMARMSNNKTLYLRMLAKFVKDATFGKLRDQVLAGDPQAGNSAHALKGMCATLGMTKLSEYCATLQYMYQGREEGDPNCVFAQASEAYEAAIAALERVAP